MQKRAFLFSAETYQASKSLIAEDLPGCEYDISAMQKRLAQIGFDVKSVRNAKREDYFLALQDIAKGMPNDAIHIFYFTGHGGHYRGINYILPVDAGSKLDASSNINQAAIDINEIISLFKGNGKLIIILDACRDGLAHFAGNYSEMTTRENVYIAYGTSFGSSSTGIKTVLVGSPKLSAMKYYHQILTLIRYLHELGKILSPSIMFRFQQVSTHYWKTYHYILLLDMIYLISKSMIS